VVMNKRPEPDLDRVRRAMREHDERDKLDDRDRDREREDEDDEAQDEDEQQDE
jgi:hypothetical protein